jgi:PIN domain nuclease of toxin-antitoxin system
LRTLLDTHVLFWWLTDDARLSSSARQVLSDDPDTAYVSVATAWEIAIKVGRGKWPEAGWLITNFERELANEGFELLHIEILHVRTAGLMQTAHRDPFDRLLAAQAASEGLTLVTSDRSLASLGVACLW